MESLKCNVFLDLDQTIITSLEYNPKTYKKISHFDHDFIHPYVTCARPNLQNFLDFLFENYNVCIWTAASKNYASFVFHRFIKFYNENRTLKLFLYNNHCNISKEITGSIKNLNMLWNYWKIEGFNDKNTFIIDDLKEVFDAQPKNCFKIKPFVLLTGKNDKELLILKKKLENLKNC